MRATALAWILGTWMAAAQAADPSAIGEVLEHSQQQRLDAFHLAADGPRAAAVRASFERLRRVAAPGVEVELRVITGETIAETLQGHVIVAHERLADLSEGQRTFVLAHELGHVVHDHWAAMGGVYRRWVPGEVTPERTDPVAGALGRDASALAHRQEFEADAWALETLGRMGFASDDAVGAFLSLGMQPDTATHPATRKRVAALRARLSGEGR
ncbi:MAG: M48 family metalloprotease [Rubrivivax sp.]